VRDPVEDVDPHPEGGGVDLVQLVEVAVDDSLVRQAVLLPRSHHDLLRYLLASSRLHSQDNVRIHWWTTMITVFTKLLLPWNFCHLGATAATMKWGGGGCMTKERPGRGRGTKGEVRGRTGGGEEIQGSRCTVLYIQNSTCTTGGRGGGAGQPASIQPVG
jgi:hypothetical protein